MRTGKTIAIMGTGAWGTALGMTMLRAGHDVRLWGRDAATVAAINERHVNPRYLPDLRLDDRLTATQDAAAALRGADCILMVTPAQTLHTVLDGLKDRIPSGAPLVLCAKGIDRQSGKLLSAVASDILPQNPVGALSGPSFASDVARGLPTAVTVAAANAGLAAELAALLSTPHFRCYSTDDLIGVEIGGALKNVMAIAAGATSGANLGASAQAAIVTRGFVELRRIGAALGARPETLLGLSGLGDLILSCNSSQSRNFAYGLALGRKENLAGLPLAEGVATAGIAARITRERGIDAPITDIVDRILRGEITVDDATRLLLSRPLKSEDDI
ncbi:glycerol-3-phosphate dehydrogenase (NAD(P)+) [Mesorhizobium sp. J18]|uniref:NAD(P)H-dependent glycerol-3-phosphate dehydrogenase n=1 Tax=Mesorhizobium sp. J18 TaxID=935263 RepID=UPI001199A5C6|nr:NAD(P)H-dependent glycerol-3-phosphate dehydrogenase [Mesorhizobium sp. J18]TWG97989.1 glycerol-3-phosphate dehydrogenase (NAD(P)+) [Mesorhizobium sp. J18]